MRYLLHGSHSTYHPATKTFVYTLSTRLRAPKQMVVDNISFTASTMDTYPAIVYVRSEAISQLISGKHAVHVTSADSHDHQSNVIAVLEETHTMGRYELKTRIRYKLDPNRTCTIIDIFFTDGDTALDGTYTPQEVAGISDADIAAHVAGGAIKWLIDLDHQNSVLEQTTNDFAEVGDFVGHVYSKLPSSQEIDFYPNQNQAIQLFQLNDHVKAISGSPTTNWEAMYESNSSNNPAAPHQGCYTLILKTSDPLETLEVLFSAGQQLYLYIYSSQIQVKVGGTYYPLHGILNDRTYVLQVWWTNTYDAGTSPNTTGTYYSRMWDTVAEQYLTGDTGALQWNGTVESSVTNKSYAISTAQSHLKSKLSNMMISTNTEAVRDDVMAYMKKKWSGSATVPVVDPDGKDASFHLVLNIA